MWHAPPRAYMRRAPSGVVTERVSQQSSVAVHILVDVPLGGAPPHSHCGVNARSSTVELARIPSFLTGDRPKHIYIFIYISALWERSPRSPTSETI